jgi:hypothetical protein
MPSLTIPTETPDSMLSSSPQSEHQPGSESPSAPPYSPITPVLSSTTVATPHENLAPNYLSAAEQPPPQPISDSDNPDVLALRATASILQIQRQQTLRDMKTLERQKLAAVADPEAFIAIVAAGKIKTASDQDMIGTSVQDATDGQGQHPTPGFDITAFGAIPAPQNVVRCPPINWEKYHIVGEPLDKLHKEQRLRPTTGEPAESGKAPDHIIAAPYRPFVDQLPSSPVTTKSQVKKQP